MRTRVLLPRLRTSVSMKPIENDMQEIVCAEIDLPHIPRACLLIVKESVCGDRDSDGFKFRCGGLNPQSP